LFMGSKAMIRAQHDREQPKPAHHAFVAHVDMRGVMTIKTIDEKAIRAWNIKNRWHDIRLAKSGEEGEDVAIVYLIRP
jgi:hypothetical protein